MKTHSYFHKATEGENITPHFALEEIQISPPLASDGDPTTCTCSQTWVSYTLLYNMPWICQVSWKSKHLLQYTLVSYTSTSQRTFSKHFINIEYIYRCM